MTTIFEAVQQLCLALPETNTSSSHGFPNFSVRGKQFATYSVNHHGDGKVALLLNASTETQSMLVESAPSIFFRPPYIGHKGWVGVELNQGLKWSRVRDLTHQAYQRSAPDALSRSSVTPNTAEPDEEMTAADIDPLKSEENQEILQQLRRLCLNLPESIEDQQFGHPAFRAGKKAYCLLGHGNRGTYLQVWVGRDAQGNFTDKRFSIPPYVGHNGWLNLDLDEAQNWQEIESMVDTSYRHFALKRMLKALDG